MPPVDMEPCRRLAYAFIEPERPDPGFFIHSALEQRGGDPPVRLAPSSHGAMMVVFCHPFFHEETLRRGPIYSAEHILRLVRHEEAEFRFVCRYRRLAVLAATNYPPPRALDQGTHHTCVPGLWPRLLHRQGVPEGGGPPFGCRGHRGGHR